MRDRSPTLISNSSCLEFTIINYWIEDMQPKALRNSLFILCFDTQFWTWISKTLLKFFHNENCINTLGTLSFQIKAKAFSYILFLHGVYLSSLWKFICFKNFTSCLTWLLSSFTTCGLKDFVGSSFLCLAQNFFLDHKIKICFQVDPISSWVSDVLISKSELYFLFTYQILTIFFFNLLTVVFLLPLTNLILWGKVFQKQIFKLPPWCFSLW